VNPELWTRVDAYLGGLLAPHDAVLDAAIAASTAAGLPEIQVTPTQGKLLHLLARGAHRILEVGTLGGYSTIWMARALSPGGRLITLEMDPGHASVARSNFERAGLSAAIELREGKAIELLPRIAAEGLGPFDLSFIDADKAGNADYFDWALRMSRRGSLIVVDNVVRDGSVVDAASTDASVLGTRRLVERVATERRVSATAIQTVGAKGYDGFLLAQVIADP
jgi:predicted O-methyltransferase YrrM